MVVPKEDSGISSFGIAVDKKKHVVCGYEAFSSLPSTAVSSPSSAIEPQTSKMATSPEYLGVSSLSISFEKTKHGVSGYDAFPSLPSTAVSVPHRRPERSSADKIVLNYLRQHEPVFSELDDLRDEIWNNQEGDKYFEMLRQSSDNPTKAGERRFYEMNKNLGNELHETTDAFYIKKKFGTQVTSLNLCMAPGGYTWTFLEKNRNPRAYGITLSEEDGGHPMYLAHGDDDERVTVVWMDLTLLAPELGTPLAKIPPQHPEAAKFTADSPFEGQTFDIVICDGQVLRVHKHQRDRQREIARLLLSQLIFGMERIKQGGTFIILLHKVDVWVNLMLLKIFESFSNIRLFKAHKVHASRSSFYIVAKNVRPESREATDAVKKWKEDWWTVTFAGEEGTGVNLKAPDDDEVHEVLETYGGRLRDLGRPIWALQLQAMKAAPYLHH